MRASAPAAFGRAFGAALLATALTAPLAGCGQSDAPPAAAPSKSPDLISYAPGSAELDTVQIVTATTSPLPISADMNARLALDESQTSRVGAPVAGRVTQVLADIGQGVKAGQALAYLDAPDLGQARADLLTAQAESTRKAREMARSHMLFDGGAISRRDLEGAQADAAGAGAELERARLRLRNLGSGAGDALALTSSVSGYVIDRQINPGQQVGAGQTPLYTVSNPRTLWLFLDVPEASSSRARIGEAVEFDVPAWPGRRFTGKITQIGLAVDPATRRVQVRAEVGNPDLALKPEMYARARLVTDDGRRAIKVPNAAIFESGMKNYIFRVEAPGRFRRVPVEVGERGDSFSYVTSGIRNGERIVGEGALLLNAQLSGG
ncbi:efflux RND transporter periplasmic adaptor subunit [Novosphingobium resinovorum]|uniref:efflux RND transporter periplasmic adaptor subunit n=2 Tax=Novosphingobium TaxID=165696 RepID=UPI0025A13BA4|nr:efflux RND transporter periplasmic adaptor subunit [Novosphingobium resinovorum]WJM28352.1 efflux RND transporter periplasmic adaptor subunit [Novosphingobium resinovorum]